MAKNHISNGLKRPGIQLQDAQNIARLQILLCRKTCKQIKIYGVRKV